MKMKNFSDLTIQALFICDDADIFVSIQEFAIIELKIQVVPIANRALLAQYMEKFVGFQRLSIV